MSVTVLESTSTDDSAAAVNHTAATPEPATTTETTPSKRQVECVPFHHQFAEVEKAIANFTKHQPFNHHYAPNLHVNRNHHHHHYNNNRGHNNHNNNHGHNNNYNNHNNHNHNHHHSNNNNYNNNNSRIQSQTFTMNAQLKQQQQQQFLSTAAQQMNRFKSVSGGMTNGNMNPMMNGSLPQTTQVTSMNGMGGMQTSMAQIPGNMNPMGGMNGMNNMNSMNNMNNLNSMNNMNMNGMNGMNGINGLNTAIPQQLHQQGYMNTYPQQMQIPPQQQQQQQQQPQLGNGFMGNTDLKFDSFQQQPQLSPQDYITPLRNVSPQLVRPGGSVGAVFNQPLEQINSNSSFGLMETTPAGEVKQPSSLALDDSTAYLGDIWGNAKGLRNSTSVWA